MDESIRLRQIIFKLERNKIYKFNTNATVTIKSLRKIIIAAANLSNKNIKMINKEEDYNNFENFTIQQLFPNEKSIEFTIKILPDLEAPIPIKLKQGASCVNHKYKFPYFYCYDCKISICSLCVQNKEHLNHKLLDKHDYVQNTDVIVNTLFNDFSGLLTDLSNDKEEEIQAYKNKIDKEIFPFLFQHLNDVKNSVFQIMNIFIENVNKSKKMLFENVESLRIHSFDGIEDLKKKIKIEDIMVDEEIFLAFDEKIKEISLEKIRILKDSKKYEELTKTINFLSSNIDSIYTEIMEIIDKKMKTNIQDKLSEKVLENLITSITRDEIDNILFSDLKKNRRPKIEPQAKRSDFLSGLFSNKNNGVSGNLTNFFSTLNKENLIRPSNITSPVKEIVNVNLVENPEDCIFYCKENTQSLIVFNEITEKIFEKEVNFKEIINFKQFLPGASWVNAQGSLYITGGNISISEQSNQAFLLEGSSTKLIAIPNMVTKRANHSSIKFNENVYVSGGKGNLTIESFDIKKYKWIKLGNLAVERENSLLFVHNNFLYNFFGTSNNNYLDSIERIELSSSNKGSQIVEYKKDSSIDLKLSGVGMIEANKDHILIIGGTFKDKFNTTNVFQYDFVDKKFDRFDLDIEGNVVFAESRLHKLKDNTYANFNKIDNNLFKIVIDTEEE